LPTVFELLKEFLISVGTRKPSPQLIFAFELKMLGELGLEPDWHKAKLMAGTVKAAQALIQRDFHSIVGLKLADNQVSELRQFLHGFIIFHLGKVPRGRTQALVSQYD